MLTGITLTIVANLFAVIAIDASWAKTYQEHLAGDNIYKFFGQQLEDFINGNESSFFVWLTHHWRIVGGVMGSQYLILGILFYILFHKFFKILDLDNLKNFQDFKEQRKSLSHISWVFTITYIVRGLILLSVGHYHNVAEFWKIEGYLLLSILFEAPNMLILYMTHLKSFKILDSKPALSQSQKRSILDQEETQTSK